MERDYRRFDRTKLEALPTRERRKLMSEIADELTARLIPFREWDGYWDEVACIIDDLKAVGHDLWSHDFDGERRQLWGWDYMRPAIAGFLQIQFEYLGPVRTFWRTEDPVLGVVDAS